MEDMYEGLRDDTVVYMKARKMALEALRAGDADGYQLALDLTLACASAITGEE